MQEEDFTFDEGLGGSSIERNDEHSKEEGDQRTVSGSHAKVRVKRGHGAGRKSRLGRPVYPMVTAREWLVEESAE
jgi:hypothetical protein